MGQRRSKRERKEEGEVELVRKNKKGGDGLVEEEW